MTEGLRSSSVKGIEIPPKPKSVTFEHLSLSTQGGEAERDYLYALLESWYGVKKEDVFKTMPTGAVWDERRMLKIAILTREGWDGTKIANALQDTNPDGKGSDSGYVHQLQRKYLKEPIIKRSWESAYEWTIEEARPIIEVLRKDHSYTAFEKDYEKRKKIYRRVWYRGKSILKEKKQDSTWVPWLSKLSNLAAFIAYYSDTRFEDAIKLAKLVKSPEGRARHWNEERLQILAKELIEEKTFGDIAEAWGTLTRDALIGKVRRTGKRTLEEAAGEEWDLWRSQMTPIAAFLVRYGELPFEQAIRMARTISERTRS